MKFHLTIFNFENDIVAMLIDDAGQEIEFPRAFLPAGAQHGAVLSFHVQLDAAATRKLAEKTREIQNGTKKDDHEGDVVL